MTVKRIAKWVFYFFIAMSVSIFILAVLSATDADKYWYYRCGAGFTVFCFILESATREWRSK
jgi:hypothetical protein